MVKVNVFRGATAPAMSYLFPEGFTVGEFFCKDFNAFPISPVRILVNGQAPSLKDCLNDGDEISYVVDRPESANR
ncbi:MAG: hypothetical protein GX751_03020 [Desulfuromonadaceae bacterium]|nr:hypothetical protein [Desulfuromonadaceae bacterium]